MARQGIPLRSNVAALDSLLFILEIRLLWDGLPPMIPLGATSLYILPLFLRSRSA
jgi:hypothetical protein